MKVMTVNLNGIRSAHRKGFFEWVLDHDPDCICVQETKAQMNQGLKEEIVLKGYQGYFSDAEKKGYSGVGIFTKRQPSHVSYQLGMAEFDQEGRFIELSFESLKVASIYLPSGTSGQTRQDFKMEVLDYFYQNYLKEGVSDEVPSVLCGDWNIAHRPEDLKNWRQNQNNSGFLPEERAWLDLVFDETGWVDAYRRLHKEKTEYTWWSYRGQARKNNTGWRIDYQVISPNLANKIQHAEVLKDPLFSDHAPLVVQYDLGSNDSSPEE